MEYNIEFWNALDKLVEQSEIIIDRPKGTINLKYYNSGGKVCLNIKGPEN